MPEETPAGVMCFGEILWDFLPDALYPGGAPANAAYHLHRHGLEVRLVSAVGRDVLGDELIRRLQHWGLPTAGINHHYGLPTGYVRAALRPSGNASYEITAEVAWDRIMPGEDTLQAAARTRALVFGSLAQRSASNRSALEMMLAGLPADAHRVFDVNLRPPHDDLVLVRSLAAQATVLKLNADEAARLAVGHAASPGQEETHARALANQTGCRRVVVTAGARGAGLLHERRWHWAPGRPVVVADTIGAGDAFLASLVAQLLSGRHSDGEMLARACRLGEWVASQHGATPAYGPHTPT